MSGPTAIPLGGYVSGGGGTLPILGVDTIEITSNANRTLTLAEADPVWISVTSDGTSTAMKNVVLPLTNGKIWLIKNATSEGYPIQCIGSSGAGVVVNSGATAIVTTDGTNMIGLTPATIPASSALTKITYQPSGTASGTTFTSWTALVAYANTIVHTIGYVGMMTYVFDLTYQSSVTLGAVAFPGTAIRWEGVLDPTVGIPSVVIPVGFTFADMTTSDSFYMQLKTIAISSVQTAHLATLDSAALTLELSDAVWTNSGTVSAFMVTNAGTFVLVVAGSGFLNDGGTESGCGLATGFHNQPLVNTDVGNGSTVNVSLLFGVVHANTLATGDAGSLQLFAFAASTVQSQSTFGASFAITATSDCTIGTIAGGTISYLSTAAQTAYLPTTSANWTTLGTVPTKAGQALDVLAAVAATGGSSGITALTGDVTASGSGSVAATVAKIHGGTVPLSTGMTTGNALYASGAAAYSLSALNLAGGSGWVTGLLPVASIAHGTAAQFFVTNSGATSGAWVTASGDLTLAAAGSFTVTGLNGVALPAGSGTGTVLTWSGAAYSWATPSGGGSFTAGGDLTGSSTVQHVQTLAGAAGVGGTIPLGDGTHNFALTAATSVQATPPALSISSAAGYSISATAGGAGGSLGLLSGIGGAGQGTNHSGGAGGTWFGEAGNGGASTGTAANANGGGFTWITGAAGTGGSGAAGAPGAWSISIGGATSALQMQSSTSDYLALGGPAGAGSGQTAQTGILRFPGGISETIVAVRAGAGSSDLGALWYRYTSSVDVFTFGSSASTATTVIQTGQSIAFLVGSATAGQLGSASTDFLTMGDVPTNCSQTGFLRFPLGLSGTLLAVRNSGNTGDLAGITYSGNDFLFGSITGTTRTALCAGTAESIALSSAGGATHVGAGGANWVEGGGSGTANSQNSTVTRDMGFVRTTNNVQATAYTFATFTGSSGYITARFLSRAVTAPSGGSIGDAAVSELKIRYRNVGGTVTLGSLATVYSDTESSMSGTVFAIAVSGTNIVAHVTNVLTATVDSEVVIDIVAN